MGSNAKGQQKKEKKEESTDLESFCEAFLARASLSFVLLAISLIPRPPLFLRLSVFFF